MCAIDLPTDGEDEEISHSELAEHVRSMLFKLYRYQYQYGCNMTQLWSAYGQATTARRGDVHGVCVTCIQVTHAM